MVRTCPHCGLVNPPTAPLRDCGYEFESGRVGASPLSDAERTRLAPTPGVVGCWLTALGAGIGLLAAILSMRTSTGGRPGGIAVFFEALIVLVRGAVLGGLVGLVAGWLCDRFRCRR
jgi:hypothetical protein